MRLPIMRLNSDWINYMNLPFGLSFSYNSLCHTPEKYIIVVAFYSAIGP